ncbi:MAG TPA: hypothetical protein VM938_01865 [Acidimicrobiales bacterium]|nr:hypothetical protein [Acidimicrobiales bacterium]
MRQIKRLIAVAIPLVSVFSVLAPTPAQASTLVTGGAVATGTGTITPGLSTVPAGQAVRFTGRVTGSVAVVSTTAPAGTSGTVSFDMNCLFQGGSNAPETSASGEGTVTGNCTGTGVFEGTHNGTTVVGTGSVTVTCNLVYSRRGGAVAVSGSCTATATVNNVLGGTYTVSTNFCVVGEFVFVPTSAPTTNSYALAGSVQSYSSKTAPCQNAKSLIP